MPSGFLRLSFYMDYVGCKSLRTKLGEKWNDGFIWTMWDVNDVEGYIFPSAVNPNRHQFKPLEARGDGLLTYQ